MAAQRVKSLAFIREDLEALSSAVAYTLEHEIKTGQHKKRVRLYSLQRRLVRALDDLGR
jgi:hypothetical protein